MKNYVEVAMGYMIIEIVLPKQLKLKWFLGVS